MKTKQTLNRRDFIGLTVAGSTILIGGAKEIKAQPQQIIRVRHNINSAHPDAKRNIENYKKVVKFMKNLSDIDPKDVRGWVKQAEIHKKSCEHLSGFLAWHRAYLYYFERICRQILKDELKIPTTEADNFALPYWDWSTSPTMPKQFWDHSQNKWDEDLDSYQKTPAGWVDGEKCKNWDGPGRKIDNKSSAPLAKVGFKEAVSKILNDNTIYGIIGWVPVVGRVTESVFKREPHDYIHVNFVKGNMACAETAALDPIFWLHHANIDRFWTQWMRTNKDHTPNPRCSIEGCGNCRNPPPIQDWLQKQVEGFYDAVGNPVKRQILRLLDTTELDYCYDTELEPIKWAECPTFKTPNNDRSIQSKPINAKTKVDKSTTLGVKQNIATPENYEKFKNLTNSVSAILQPHILSSSQTNSPSFLLTIEVENPKNPAIWVRVFIKDSSDKTELSVDKPSYVGDFTFFERVGEPHHHGHESKSESRYFVFDVTDTIIKLSKLSTSKPFKLENLTISIYPKSLNGKFSKEDSIKLISFGFDVLQYETGIIQ